MEGVRIRIGFDGGRVTGQVKSRHPLRPDETLDRGKVVLIPESGQGYAAESSAEFDEKGSFEIIGIPPGRYKLFATSHLDLYDLYDPEIQRVLGASGIPITLDADDHINADPVLLPDP